MATSPAPAPPQSPIGPGAAGPAATRSRKRRPGLAALFVFLALCGLAVAGFGIWRQREPRTFTPQQRARIEAWEVGKRWRTTPKARIFPAAVPYWLAGRQLGSAGALRLTARRLEIAGQSGCAAAAGASRAVAARLTAGGCQAILRATYTDASSSLAVTVGVAVLRDQAAAAATARLLTATAPGEHGALARHLVLLPFAVAGTPAAQFRARQRQLAWVGTAGPYLVVATVGYADGRRHVRVGVDPYTLLEMTSLARGVVVAVAAPLGQPPPVPHCPALGGPACLSQPMAA